MRVKPMGIGRMDDFSFLMGKRKKCDHRKANCGEIAGKEKRGGNSNRRGVKVAKSHRIPDPVSVCPLPSIFSVP